MSEQVSKPIFYFCGEKKSIQRLSDFYSFSGITAETADQVQNRKLLKAFHSHLCSVQVTSVCLVAGYLTMLAPEARPKLHENLNRLPYKERRHGSLLIHTPSQLCGVFNITRLSQFFVNYSHECKTTDFYNRIV